MPRDAEISFALTGDSIVTRHIHRGTAPQQDVYDLIEGADVSVTSLELPLHDYDHYPAADRGALYFRGPRWAADELKAAGFDVLACATNHMGDYTHGGMLETIDVLERQGLPYAGLGRNLSHARAPAFVDTPAGRVALVAATSTFLPGSQAGDARGEVAGRPGISPLRLRCRYVVSEESLRNIRDLSDELGLTDLLEQRGGHISGDGEAFPFLDVSVGSAGHVVPFELGEDPRVDRQLDDDDASVILDQVRWASQQARWVVVSLHAHEGANGGYSDGTVPSFLEEFAHGAIDAGADLFVGHGPQQLRGIEIYNGRPIFYSLGSFIVQNDTITRFPADAYRYHGLPDDATPADVYLQYLDGSEEPYDVFDSRRQAESVVPICEGDGDGIDRIMLHPIELGYDRAEPRRGVPVPATGDIAEGILSDLDSKSAPYDTRIDVDGSRGIVSL